MSITTQHFDGNAVESEDLFSSAGCNVKFSNKKAESKIPVVSMNTVHKALLAITLVGSGILLYNFSTSKPEVAVPCLELPTEVYASMQRNGKLNGAEKLEKTFTQSSWHELGFPVITEDIKLALQHQLHVLEKNELLDSRRIGNLNANYAELREVLELLIQRAGTQPSDLNQYLDVWQSKGENQHGDVYFTGYFTPVLKVCKTKTGKYKFPIYAFPKDWKGKLPTRKQIEKQGALDTKNLVLAYASNRLDVYFMQLQGSGTVEFVDTKERVLLRYAGENGHPYRNIQRFFKHRDDLAMQNLSPESIKRFLLKHPEKTDSVLHYDPSFTFFEPKVGLAKGAANVPLMENISIAADSRYFPLGSVVLAAFPIYKNGRITHHEYKILLPQDVGGAVKGAGHVDVYCGNGALGQSKASALHHYGRLWVLLPKKDEQMALAE